MNFLQLLKQTARTLTDAKIEAARFEATQLLQCAGISQKTLPPLIVGDEPSEIVTAKQLTDLSEFIARRIGGEPLQYILGEWEFYGITLSVGEGVLIPRPDTEIVVEKCIELLRGMPSPKIADLCSGSGAIAVALAENTSASEIIAVELSQDALVYLAKNTAPYASIRVLNADIFLPATLSDLDMIVSNPPYITANAMKKLSAEVRWEPQMALLAADDGLVFYRHIAKKYKSTLKSGGVLVFEIGYDQGESVPAIMQDCGYANVTMIRDYAGNPRCVFGLV